MNQNPLFDYHLVDIIEDLQYPNILRSLKRFNIDKEISIDEFRNQIDLGKTKAILVKVDFKNFMKKYKKYGIDGVYLKFKKAKIEMSKEKINEMVVQFSKLKTSYDHYLFFE